MNKHRKKEKNCGAKRWLRVLPIIYYNSRCSDISCILRIMNISIYQPTPSNWTVFNLFLYANSFTDRSTSLPSPYCNNYWVNKCKLHSFNLQNIEKKPIELCNLVSNEKTILEKNPLHVIWIPPRPNKLLSIMNIILYLLVMPNKIWFLAYASPPLCSTSAQLLPLLLTENALNHCMQNNSQSICWCSH